MIQKIALALATLAAVLALSPNLVLADAKSQIQCGVNAAASGDCNTQPSGSLDNTITTIINILSAIVGVAAVVMIIIAGLRYVTSAGNAESAKSARNTILYAVIGLVIVALAQIITHFVIHVASSNPISPQHEKKPASSNNGGLTGTSGSPNSPSRTPQ